METTTSAVENGTGPRRIEDGRLTKALSQPMGVREHAPRMCAVCHDSEIYTVDLEGGACSCKDHEFRGDEFVCKHVLRGCIHHAFAEGVDTRLVARVLAAVREVGCVHGVRGCNGPTALSDGACIPCEECVAATPGHWTVWCVLHNERARLGGGETTAADAPVVATDGGQPDGVRTTEDWHGDERRADCRLCGRALKQGYVDLGEEVCVPCHVRARRNDIGSITGREPRRSETADFGGGSSSGIDDL